MKFIPTRVRLHEESDTSKTAKTRQKHHLEGNAVPAGYCHTNAH